MEAKTIPVARLDHLDAERFREMVESPPFDLLIRRIVDQQERYRDRCTEVTKRSEFYRAQGAVAAIEVVLELPGMILKEIEKPAKKG